MAPEKNFKLLKYMVSNWQSSDLQSTTLALHHHHNWCVDGETLVPTAMQQIFTTTGVLNDGETLVPTADRFSFI